MNRLPYETKTGTMGELIVQLRLLQYGIQAAPPLKDSGNDLIAVRGSIFRAIQVKTTGNSDGTWRIPRNKRYHILALVRLRVRNSQLYLDETEVYLLDRKLIESRCYDLSNLSNHRISQELIDRLFRNKKVIKNER